MAPAVSSSAEQSPVHDTGGPSARSVVGLLVAVELVSGLIQGMLPTLTPAIGTELAVSTAGLGWVSSVFLLSSALWVPVFGKLGDLYGHRLMLRIAMVLLACGSVLVALAPNYPVFLAGRALQGALLCFLPLEMALVRDRLTPERARSAIALLIGALTLGVSLGGIVAGALVQVMSSAQAVLWVPAVTTAACIAVPFFFVPESSTRARAGLDWPGAVLLTGGLAPLMLGIALGPSRGWGDGAVLGLLGGGVVLLAVWWRVELRTSAPLVDVRHLSRPRVLVLYGAAVLVGMTVLGTQTVWSTFAATETGVAGYGFGLSGLALGFFLLPMGAAAFVGSWLASPVVGRIGQRSTVVAGFVLMTAGYLLALPLSGSVGGMAVAFALTGVGGGTVIAVLPAMILERLPAAEAGISAGVYNMLRTLGGSVLAAAAAAVLSAATDADTGLVRSSGYAVIWLLCAGLSATAAGLVAATRRIDRAPEEAVPAQAAGASY